MNGKLERFAVFSGKTCYPDGGWSDFRGSASEPGRARELARAKIVGETEKMDPDWAHIVDLQTGEVLWTSNERGETIHVFGWNLTR